MPAVHPKRTSIARRAIRIDIIFQNCILVCTFKSVVLNFFVSVDPFQCCQSISSFKPKKFYAWLKILFYSFGALVQYSFKITINYSLQTFLFLSKQICVIKFLLLHISNKFLNTGQCYSNFFDFCCLQAFDFIRTRAEISLSPRQFEANEAISSNASVGLWVRLQHGPPQSSK